jgi:hypothetical protein
MLHIALAFYVLDVSNPASIVKTDEYKPYGSNAKVECIGSDVFYYDTHFDTLIAFDASNPSSLIQKDQLSLIFDEFTLSNNYAYCINNQNISIIDISK